jgi:hypothetical protein
MLRCIMSHTEIARNCGNKSSIFVCEHLRLLLHLMAEERKRSLPDENRSMGPAKRRRVISCHCGKVFQTVTGRTKHQQGSKRTRPCVWRRGMLLSNRTATTSTMRPAAEVSRSVCAAAGRINPEVQCPLCSTKMWSDAFPDHMRLCAPAHPWGAASTERVHPSPPPPLPAAADEGKSDPASGSVEDSAEW